MIENILLRLLQALIKIGRRLVTFEPLLLNSGPDPAVSIEFADERIVYPVLPSGARASLPFEPGVRAGGWYPSPIDFSVSMTIGIRFESSDSFLNPLIWLLSRTAAAPRGRTRPDSARRP